MNEPEQGAAERCPEPNRGAAEDLRFPSPWGACPACGGGLIEIRSKFVCGACHRICETCCEGEPAG
ncbi:MAG: hypothetical protein FJ309_03150 [Planctomycetes bacterium]|nr:hypothetical protein [Planctomycetota bacterium]